MGDGTWKAALVGGAVALILVIGVAAFAFMGTLPSSAEKAEVVAEGPLLVALVLPDADGVLTVRVLDSYDHKAGPLTVTSVDPLTTATVPGTSASTLADAYKFGGGAGLAAAYAEGADVKPPNWVVVGPKAWASLMQSAPVALTLTTDVEVFDGTTLYSFPAGATSVTATEVAQLMNGAAYLSAPALKAIREGVGDALAPALLRADMVADGGIDSSVTPEQWAIWRRGVNSQPVRADTTD